MKIWWPLASLWVCSFSCQEEQIKKWSLLVVHLYMYLHNTKLPLYKPPEFKAVGSASGTYGFAYQITHTLFVQSNCLLFWKSVFWDIKYSIQATKVRGNKRFHIYFIYSVCKSLICSTTHKELSSYRSQNPLAVPKDLNSSVPGEKHGR